MNRFLGRVDHQKSFSQKYIDKTAYIRYPIKCINYPAALAQLVERFHGKEEVAGSSPASGFHKKHRHVFLTICRCFFISFNKNNTTPFSTSFKNLLPCSCIMKTIHACTLFLNLFCPKV